MKKAILASEGREEKPTEYTINLHPDIETLGLENAYLRQKSYYIKVGFVYLKRPGLHRAD